jgi:cytoskeleton protein RodZ
MRVTPTENRLSGVTTIQPPPIPAAAGLGAQLRAAREAQGLSLDQVAQQLKLAQRQVKAMEEENFGELPGRTFSRGFVRNYARLLNLDAHELLAQLPNAAQAPALESPALHSTGTTMAELPSTDVAKRSFARWVIPLVLVGCVVAAAAYEWYRSGLSPLNEPQRKRAAAAVPAASAPTPLPNPLANENRAAAGPSPAAGDDNASASQPTRASAQPTSTSAPSTSTSASSAGISAPVVATTEPSPALPTEAPLLLAYAGPSWTEVRDRNGQLLISRLVAGHSNETVRGVGPFDVVLGNARAVTLTYRGKQVDLAPYTRQNVARLTLP